MSIYINNMELSKSDRTSIRDSILINKIYDDGVIKAFDNRFIKIYRIIDINYELSDNKESIDKAYKSFINTVDKTAEISLIINSRKIGQKFIDEKVVIKKLNDKYDYIRDALNENIYKNSNINTLIKDKYLVVAIRNDRNADKDTIINQMRLITNSIKRNFESIPNARLYGLTKEETYKFMHLLYNKDRVDDKLYNSDFDLISSKTCESLGIEAKDIIMPKIMEFYKDYIKLNNKYIVALHSYELNKNINTDTIEKLTDNNFEVMITLKERPSDPIESNKLIERELENVEYEIYQVQQRLTDKSASTDLVPQNMKLRREEAIEVNNQIKKDNDYLFDMGLYALVYGNSIEDVYENVYNFKNNAMKIGVFFEESVDMQEQVFNTCMPYGINQTQYTRCITSEGITGFIPFNSADLIDTNGDYFGRNLITNNPVTYNIMHADNYSSLIFGMSGKGKSFLGKQTFMSRILRNEKRASIMVDPSGEWKAAVETLDGEVVYIEAGGEHHINIFDIDKNYGKNALADKEDFLISIFGYMVGEPLTTTLKTTVSKAIRKMYGQHNWEKDSEDVPTIEEFEKCLQEIVDIEKDEEDRKLLKAIKYYSSESYCTLFRGKTNINLNNRIICFDLTNLGSSLKPLAMQVMLDFIWMRIYKNKVKHIPTDVIIDELHLMFLSKDTAEFMSKYWKMLRKNLGCPMGLTQNPEDVLKSDFGRTVLSNSGLLVSLSIQDKEAEILKEELNLSDSEIEYIKNKESGQGLIYVHSDKGKGTKIVVPFENPYNENNLIYKMFDTSSKSGEENN